MQELTEAKLSFMIPTDVARMITVGGAAEAAWDGREWTDEDDYVLRYREDMKMDSVDDIYQCIKRATEEEYDWYFGVLVNYFKAQRRK